MTIGGEDEDDDVTTVIEDGGLQFLQNPHDPTTLTVQSLTDDVQNAIQQLAPQTVVTSDVDATDAQVDQLIAFAQVQDNNLLQPQQQQAFDSAILNEVQLHNVLPQVRRFPTTDTSHC